MSATQPHSGGGRGEKSEPATIAELVLDHPRLLPVLDTLGLDSCCGGHLTPEQAAAEHGLDPEEVRAALDEALAREGGGA